MQQQRLVKTANGGDAVLVADQKADTMENGNVAEEKLSEELESEMSSPFSLPGEATLTHWIFNCMWCYLKYIYLFCSTKAKVLNSLECGTL